jgi:preprotein translocase subunit SecE
MDKNNEAAKQQPAKKTNKNKKPNIFVRMGRKIKEIFSELKKVTWPSFKTVLKQLGCVLVTVILVLAVIMLMDLGLQKLLELAQGKNASGALVKLFEVL